MFQALPVWLNIALFIAAALLVWFAGSRVACYADEVERITGAGEALVGMLLLGVITALPELGVTVTAAYAGNPALALNNLLGGMSLNIAILAAADFAVAREALSATLASPVPLLQGTLFIMLLAVVAAATVVGDISIFGIGAWAWAVLIIYFLSLQQIRAARGRAGWVPEGDAARSRAVSNEVPSSHARDQGHFRALAARIAAGAAAILVAGYVLSQSGDALAKQTGLGASFFGAVFLALSTSLPEITIVMSSVRIGRYGMAISNIFGANLFGLAMIFIVDAVYRGEPVLDQGGPFSTFASLLGIAVGALFIAGLLERRHRMLLRMGVDSVFVLGTYVAGIFLLYRLR